MDSTRSSLLQKLGQLLGGNDAPPGPTPRRRETGAATPVPTVTTGQHNLSSLSIPSSKLTAGSLQLIGLADIRTVLGDHWEQQSARIFHLVEGIFRRRLDVTDAYYKVDDENFLILFTRLRRREAEFKARMIAGEIEKLIVGEGQDITVVSQVAEIDRQFVLEKINSLDELIHHVRTATEGGSYESDSARQTAGSTVDTMELSYIPELEQDFSALFQRTSVEDYLKQCSASFRPMFNTRRRAFTSFLTNVINKRTGRMVLVDDDPLLDKPEDLLPALDRFSLGAALLGLHRMMAAGLQTKLVVPISYDTMSTSRLREQYFSRLRDLPDGIRTYIAFAITNLPTGMPASRLAELISYLRPLSSLQVAHMQPDPRLVDTFATAGCYGLSTEIPADQVDTMKLQADLGTLAKRIHLHRNIAILANINNRDYLRTGITAGFDIIWGDAVSGTVDTPGMLEGLRSEHIPS